MPASLQVYILLELQWKKSPSYEDPSDPCEIPVFAPPHGCVRIGRSLLGYHRSFLGIQMLFVSNCFEGGKK